MAGLSKYLALALFNMSLNPVRSSFTPPVVLYLGLHTAATSDSIYGSEATYGSYARQALNNLTAEPAAETAAGDVDIVVTNGSALTFPASAGPSAQTITHWAIWDSQGVGDGNVLYSGALSTPRTVTVDDRVVVPERSITLTIK